MVSASARTKATINQPITLGIDEVTDVFIVSSAMVEGAPLSRLEHEVLPETVKDASELYSGAGSFIAILASRDD